jgi:hypothetical protein
LSLPAVGGYILTFLKLSSEFLLFRIERKRMGDCESRDILGPLCFIWSMT